MMKTHCSMCDRIRECNHFDLYINGSEGCFLCEQCSMRVTNVVRELVSLAQQSRIQIIKEKYRK